MKVTTEKLPKSLLALSIELDADQVEKGLDRAARRLSQKYTMPGFRKGKAPRFIIENYLGREALVEEASEDLINKAFKKAIEQENIEPVGPASLENVTSADPFTFRVTVPVEPTVMLGDYREIRVPFEVEPVTDEAFDRSMEVLRDKHVVLRELDDSRPAQQGDQLTVKLETLVDGKPLGEVLAENDEGDEVLEIEGDVVDAEVIEGDVVDAEVVDDIALDVEGDVIDTEVLDEEIVEIEDEVIDAEVLDDDVDELTDDELDELAESDLEGEKTTLDLEPGRLVDELYEGLLGVNVGESRAITATLPEDHANEAVRGKEVTFEVEVLGMQERMLPDWDDLPSLEEFDGTIDELRAKTRADLEAAVRNNAERETLDTYTAQLVEQTEFDVPDVMVAEVAERMLEDQGRQFEQYGITIDQMLQYRGKTREDAIEEFMPDAEKQVRTTLALQKVVSQEGLAVTDEEVEAEVAVLLEGYEESQRENVGVMLKSQLRANVETVVIDRKLRERLLAIATGEAPALEAVASTEPALSNQSDAMAAVTSSTDDAEPEASVANTADDTAETAASSQQ